jgi:hypothetical protein
MFPGFTLLPDPRRHRAEQIRLLPRTPRPR